MRVKLECNNDCFNCIYPDCVNNDKPTKEEVQMLQEALGNAKQLSKCYDSKFNKRKD